jgi:hypothetical protein
MGYGGPHVMLRTIFKRLQGGVKLPTGGRFPLGDEPASAPGTRREVSRSGQMPEPTVTVRMKEDGTARPHTGAWRHAPWGVFRQPSGKRFMKTQRSVAATFAGGH